MPGHTSSFINGQLAGEAVHSVFPILGQPRRVIVGDTHRPLVGSLDEVRLFDRALSASEARAIFEAEKPETLPTPTPVAWDFSHVIMDANSTAATQYLMKRQNIQLWAEAGARKVNYWAPPCQQAGSLTYRFSFPQPIRQAELMAGVYAIEFNGADLLDGRGAGAMHASGNGRDWTPLYDFITDGPQWGVSFWHGGDLPMAVLGTQELYLRVTLVNEAPLDSDFSTAQHVRTDQMWRDEGQAPFILNVKLEAPE